MLCKAFPMPQLLYPNIKLCSMNSDASTSRVSLLSFPWEKLCNTKDPTHNLSSWYKNTTMVVVVVTNTSNIVTRVMRLSYHQILAKNMKYRLKQPKTRFFTPL